MTLKGRTDLERVAILHGALVLVTAGLLQLPSGVPWIFTAPANLLLALTIPSVLLAPVFLKGKRYLPLLLQLASMAVGIAYAAEPLSEELKGRPIAPWRLIYPFSPVEETPRVRLVSFNAGVGLASADSVAKFAQDTDADIVALVEVTDRLAKRLDQLASERYPHRVFYGGGIDGKALLSKFPITSHELFRLEDGRPYMRAEVDLDGTPLSLLVVHLSPAIGVLDRGVGAGRDLDRLLESVDSKQTSVIVGDFNTTERSGSHARLKLAGLSDSFEEVGKGFGHTFPMFGRYFGLPIGCFMRIDYVWHGSGLVAKLAMVGRDLGSDHLPLVVDLGLVDG